MMKKFDIPPVWTLAAAVSIWLIAAIMPVFHLQVPLFVSILIAALGFGLAGWSAIWFRRKKTTIEPRDVPTTLIVEGPFRVNRNPIYTGMTLILLAFALWLGHLVALIPVLAFPFVITMRFIKDEESQLRKLFGDEAEAYISKTRRW